VTPLGKRANAARSVLVSKISVPGRQKEK
jgi:hypothetical protein